MNVDIKFQSENTLLQQCEKVVNDRDASWHIAVYVFLLIHSFRHDFHPWIVVSEKIHNKLDCKPL